MAAPPCSSRPPSATDAVQERRLPDRVRRLLPRPLTPIPRGPTTQPLPSSTSSPPPPSSRPSNNRASSEASSSVDGSTDGTDGDTALFFDANLLPPRPAGSHRLQSLSGRHQIPPASPSAPRSESPCAIRHLPMASKSRIILGLHRLGFSRPAPSRPRSPGFSGVQGVQGESLINLGLLPVGGVQFITGNYFTEDVDRVSTQTPRDIHPSSKTPFPAVPGHRL